MMRTAWMILMVVMGAQCAFSQVPIQVGEKHTLSSDIMGEDREVWIGLPKSHDPARAYPVLYVMDAEWQFDMMNAVMKELAVNDKAPEHIVVGIPYVSFTERNKDLTFTATTLGSDGKPNPELATWFGEEMTGGGPMFLRHLVEEVVPFVESQVRTNGFDILLGHSLSGYFGAYIMTMDQPFDAFQLYDPSVWYQGMEAIEHLEKTMPVGFKTNVYIAGAAGGRNYQAYNIEAHEKLHVMLKEKGVNSSLHIYAKEDHGSIRMPALVDGITQLYEGYGFGFIKPEDKLTLEDAQAHFRAFSEKVNFQFQVPKDVYRWIGYANFTQKNWTEALRVYEQCLQDFDQDPYFLQEVSDCYFGVGEAEKSLNYLEKAALLDPENPTLIAKLKTRKENQ